MESRVRRGRAWAAVPTVVAALVVGVGGCADADPPPTTDRPASTATTASTANPATTASTATTEATEATADPRSETVLVEIRVSGGFAGVDNRLVVREDGSWTVRSRTGEPRAGRMTAADLAELRAALEDPAYARVPDRPTGPPVADGFQYAVTYHDRTVVAGDRDRPAALQRVLDALPEGGPPTSP
ncbi:hypothetical protein [Streptomyces sp. NPDC093105]|uniref:hypothetical protein n=1 Tax=Streptomyces sp. NPDC093105 TaxID=3366029 RepID=UPI003809600F